MWFFSKRKERQPKPSRRATSSFRPQLEALEDRWLPSATVGWAFGTGSQATPINASLAGADSRATAVATDQAGDVYVTGYIGQNNPGGAPAPMTNLNPNGTTDVGAGMFVAKYNPDHTLAWVQNIANAQAGAIAVDSSGNVLLTGSFTGTAAFGGTNLTSTLSSSGSSTADVFVTKLDSNGNFLWATKAGGQGNDSGNSIAVDSSGDAYVTGNYQLSATFGSTTLPAGYNNARSGFVLKLDPNGNYSWAENLSNTSYKGEGEVSATAIAVDSSGNAYVTGNYEGTVNFNPSGSYLLSSASRRGGYSSQDAFVVKLNAQGGFAWAGSMGGTGADGGGSIAVDGQGNVYLTGTYGPQGQDSDSNNNFNPGSGSGLKLPLYGSSNVATNIFVEKLTTNGKLVWGYGMGSSGTGTGNSAGGIAVDTSGNVYLTGGFTQTLTINSASGQTSLTSQGGNDALVLKLDTNGKFVSDADLGGTSSDTGSDIAWDPFTGNAYAVGSYEGTASFGPFTLTTAGGLNVYGQPQQDLYLAELTM